MVSTRATDDLAHLAEALTVAGLEEVDLALPAEREAALAGMRLNWLDWGTAGRPAVIFLHGGCLTARTWDLVCLALRTDHHCLAPDARGHGDSEWAPDAEYGIKAFVDDLARLVEHLGLRRPILVGQSLGGLTGLAYARRRPDEVAGLALVDVVADVQDEGRRRIVDFAAKTAQLGSLEEFLERAQAFNPARDPRLLRRSLQHNLRRLPSGRWAWKYDPRIVAPERHERIRADLREECADVGGVTCPVLVLRGANSDVVTPEAAESFARSLPDGRVATVPDAGHTIQGDNARGLVEALRPFLAEVGAP